MGIAADALLCRVRAATEKDLSALSELLDRYFTEGDIRHRDTQAALLEQLQTPLPGWYVAEASAGLAGCVLGRRLTAIPGAAECKRLYVSPGARGKGVAGRLMDTLESAARASGFAWMYLDSKDNFGVAMAMYARRGYTECPRFNDNPEATFFFRKRLL